MQIIVSGKQVDVGSSLKEHVENKLSESISKYLDRVTSVKVVVSKQGHLFRVDINGNTGTHSGVTIKSFGENDDVYVAFDQANDKIEKQLRRYKRRLTNHHKTQESHHKRDHRAMEANKYVLADIGAGSTNTPESAEAEEDAPLVIAEKTSDLLTVTVGDAVMHMDLADLPALMFINSQNGRLNVVYRRKDGNISWVDPKEAIAKSEAAA